MYKIFSHDPGGKNWAYACSRHRQQPITEYHEARIDECGHMKNLVNVLKHPATMRQQVDAFRTELDLIWERCGPFDEIIAERFMGRGVSTMLTETVNIMLGVLGSWASAHGLPFPVLIPASVWKNDFNRAQSRGLKDAYRVTGTSPHQLDAALIGYWMGSKLLGETSFGMMSDVMRRDRYIWWAEASSVERVVRRRQQREYWSQEDADGLA